MRLPLEMPFFHPQAPHATLADISAQAYLHTVVGLSIVGACIAGRSILDTQFLREVNYPRAKVLSLLIATISWGFVTITGYIYNNVGPGLSRQQVYSAVSYSVGLYLLSKVMIYVYLAERVYDVWKLSPMKGSARDALISCIILITLRTVLLGLEVVKSDLLLTPDDKCVVDLSLELGSLSRSYAGASDVLISSWLFGMMVLPALRSSPAMYHGRIIIFRSLVISGVALTASLVNIALIPGFRLGCLCLGAWTTEVVCNSVAIYWATSTAEAPEWEADLDTSLSPPGKKYGMPTADLPRIIISNGGVCGGGVCGTVNIVVDLDLL